MLSSRYLHTLCPPDRILQQVQELQRICDRRGYNHPFVIWEPSPPMCTPEWLSTFLGDIRVVDVFSPNHLELLGLFGRSTEPFNKELIEALATEFLAAGIGLDRHPQDGAIIIRAGEHGCLVLSANTPATWLPPFYDPDHLSATSKSKIIDTTGASNAFLGGFAVGHDETKDYVKAACYGTVAASFVLEQIGVPTLGRKDNGGEGEETWNGERVRERLRVYMQRVSPSRCMV